jgi:hypothetical protein
MEADVVHAKPGTEFSELKWSQGRQAMTGGCQGRDGRSKFTCRSVLPGTPQSTKKSTAHDGTLLCPSQTIDTCKSEYKKLTAAGDFSKNGAELRDD